MSHLGDRLVALIDGELDHDARDRILAHLALCPACRAEADTQRQLKSALSSLDGPAPSPAFVDRLRTLAEPGEPTPPAPPAWPGDHAGGRGGGQVAAFRSPGGSSSASAAALAPLYPLAHPRRGPRRAGFAVAGLFCAAAAAATTAFAVGESSGGEVRVVPPVGRYAVEHAVTAPGGVLTDPEPPAVTTVSTAPSP